jgi:LysR family hydrogen peroxide-inducible transcriptional activator
VFRSSSGRDESYRQLAAIIGEVISAEQQVRPIKSAR